MYILGIWDGHDAGAALIEDGRIIYAANEERFTKRKLEINFPSNAIRAALSYAQLKPTDVTNIAFTTTELTKTIDRVFPFVKENYYQFRRRKMLKPGLFDIKHNHWLKYALTSIGPLPGCAAVSRGVVSRELKRLGFKDFKLDIVEHHTAHAATAAFTSGFGKALVITLDGVGDGLCGSISTFENGKLERKQSISAKDSIGMLYEQVTNIVGMRELEDEGKVMAMAVYSYPFPYEENRLRGFYDVTGTLITAKYRNWHRQYKMLDGIAWGMPREQFAYMAQQLLENSLAKLVSNAVDRYNIRNIVLAGGIFANVKANMLLRKLDNVDGWYVFPHMGDGGIALGSALYSMYNATGKCDFRFSAYLGDSYTQDSTEQAVKQDRSLSYSIETPLEQAAHAAELIRKGEYMMWFQGRMEFGPRALGDRSIIAPADSEEVKDRLNMYVKKREWYQPFCPSVLESDARNIVDYDGKGYDRYMTMAYMTKEELRHRLKSVIHMDGSARPQMVGAENPTYMELLKRVKRETGLGIVLNTSFNLHGFPIVMAPQDAIATMKATKTRYMFMDGLFITNKAGV
jgi:carbamoyltransferase